MCSICGGVYQGPEREMLAARRALDKLLPDDEFLPLLEHQHYATLYIQPQY